MPNVILRPTSFNEVHRLFGLRRMVAFTAVLVLAGCVNNWGAVACGMEYCHVETGHSTEKRARRAAERACELAKPTECKVKFASRERCIAIVRRSNDPIVAAEGPDRQHAELSALKACRQGGKRGCDTLDVSCSDD